MGTDIKTFSTFEGSFVCAAAADNIPISQLTAKTGIVGTAKFVGLLSVRIQLLTAVISQFRLVAPTSKGTPNPAIDCYRVGGGNRGTSGGGNTPRAYVANVWTVVPTFGAAVPSRRAYLPGVIGSVVEWTWPEDDPYTRELYDDQATTVGAVIQNVTGGACGQTLVTWRWMEFTNP